MEMIVDHGNPVQALKLLAVFAAIRVDDKPDNIENALSSSLLEQGPVSQSRSIEASTDLLASSTWEEVVHNYNLFFIFLFHN